MAWNGTAGGMPDGRWVDPPDAPAAIASGASARQQGFATPPQEVSNLAAMTFQAGAAAVARGTDSLGGLPGAKQCSRATAFAPEDPTMMGLVQRWTLEAGHSSQNMTTVCGAG